MKNENDFMSDISPVLIIGAAGFVGTHLMQYFSHQNIEFFATKLPNESIKCNCKDVFDLNILDTNAITDLLYKVKPKAIINLAAQSSVGLSWTNIKLTIDINVTGTMNLLDAVKTCCKETKVLIIGSSEEYGKAPNHQSVISEDFQLNPSNPYAVSKSAQTVAAKMFYSVFGLNVTVMRPFNHIGVGQLTGFVVPDFCYQIAKIEQGICPPIIKVGNLSAKRDFSDVKDIVRGYLLALKYTQPGEVYNIGSGKSISIQQILDILLGLSKVSISIVEDKDRLRPSDTPVIEADISKFHQATGYLPQIPIELTLEDTLNYFRNKVLEEQKK